MGKPIIALVYDFDKTLCTRDMQEYGGNSNAVFRLEQCQKPVYSSQE